MNAAAEAEVPVWLAANERLKFERKWTAFAKERTGTRPPRSDPAFKAIRRLNFDRNQVAHFRGLRQADGTYHRAGPPVAYKGGISPIRAYFDAALAKAVVDDADEAFKVL